MPRPSSRVLAAVACALAVALGILSVPAVAPAATLTAPVVDADASPQACPCSIWDGATPTEATTTTTSTPTQLGVRFTADVDGRVTGVRYYKGPGTAGGRTGSLWTDTGDLLARAEFTQGSASGWQTVTFAQPVDVTAGATYVASYLAPAGDHSLTEGGLTFAVDAHPLHAVSEGGVSAPGDGFPSSASTTNHWVDVDFVAGDDTPAVGATSPGAGATNVPVHAQVTAALNGPVRGGTAHLTLANPAGHAVDGFSAYDAATRSIDFAPTRRLAPGTTYVATVRGGTLPSGAAMPPATWSFTTAGKRACPCLLFDSSALPARTDSGRRSPTSLGVRFTPTTTGWVSGIRYYKSAGNTGTHTGSLWSADGRLLATAAFARESDSGWQEATFGQGIQLRAGRTYVASYFSPTGHHAVSEGFYAGGWDNTVLTAPAGGAGVYLRGSDGFPRTRSTSNYWVTPVFRPGRAPDTTPPAVVSRSPVDGERSVSPSVSPAVVFSEGVAAGSVRMAVTTGAGSPVAGTVGYDPARRTATFSPDVALARGSTYSVRVRARDRAGNAMSAVSWSFTTAMPAARPGVCPCSAWDDGDHPAVASVAGGGAAELGVRFTADVDGLVSGVRFFKGPGNTGAHVGSLWRGDGRLLASARFTNESSAGWQTVMFSSPVSVRAGTTYVASYSAPEGGYAVTRGGLSRRVSAPPLHVVADGGVRTSGSGFPSRSSSTNYWVDVVFSRAPDTTPPAVVSRSPVDGERSVSPSVSPAVVFSEGVAAGSVRMAVTTGAGSPVAGTVGYDPARRTATFSPDVALARGSTYSVRVRARDRAGNSMSAVSWSFTTAMPAARPGVCPCSAWDDGDHPAVASVAGGGAAELGVRFTSDVDGLVSGVRFFKGPGNTGVHVGSLWRGDGRLLASARFTNESSAGWQTVMFSSPVSVRAGRTYVASYSAPAGGYAVTRGGLSRRVSAPPLHVLADGGVRTRGSGFPSRSSSTNYWVDVVFSRAPRTRPVPSSSPTPTTTTPPPAKPPTAKPPSSTKPPTTKPPSSTTSPPTSTTKPPPTTSTPPPTTSTPPSGTTTRPPTTTTKPPPSTTPPPTSTATPPTTRTSSPAAGAPQTASGNGDVAAPSSPGNGTGSAAARVPVTSLLGTSTLSQGTSTTDTR